MVGILIQKEKNSLNRRSETGPRGQRHSLDFSLKTLTNTYSDDGHADSELPSEFSE